MHENQRGTLVTGFGPVGEKKLAVDFEAVGSAEYHLLWRDELRGRKIVRLRFGRNLLRRCAVS